MKDIVILGILIKSEAVDTVLLQELLTKYGNIIRTRLGLHESHYVQTSKLKGMLLLELDGVAGEIALFEDALKHIEGIEVQKIHFQINH